MLIRTLAILVISLVACVDEPTVQSTVTTPSLGEPCGDHDACPEGTTCITYYGVAGAAGPQLKSCEIRCTDDSMCPAGDRCTDIVDGPGEVCR